MAILIPDKTIVCNGVPVKEYLLTNHNPNKIDIPSIRTKTLKGITVHNTESINTSGTTMSEQYTRATVNGNMKSVRVHYYVDNDEAWQNLPLDYTSWHSADGNGDGNTATISIECIMSYKGYEKSEDNCARLCAYLLKKYNLTTENLYTHTYWLNVRDGQGIGLTKDSRCTLRHPYKTCPAYIIPHWDMFINKVKAYMISDDATEKKSEKMYFVQVGAFKNEENAKKMLETVKKDYPNSFIKII